MTAEKARYLAWFWIVLWVLATASMVLQVLVAAAPIRFVISLAFVVATAWQAQRYWRRSTELADGGGLASDGVETPRSRPGPPEGSSFDERLAWLQEQPNFHRTWIYGLVVSVVLIGASVTCFIGAAVRGSSALLTLGVLWLVPAILFSVITWRTRAGGRPGSPPPT